MLALAFSLVACISTTNKDAAVDTADTATDTASDTADTVDTGDTTDTQDTGDTVDTTDTSDTVDTDTGSSGEGTPVSALAAGDLVISEIMHNPHGLSVDSGGADSSDLTGEWLEIYNASGSDVNLNGLVLADADATNPQAYTLRENVVVRAGSYVVLGNSTDRGQNGDVAVAAAWDSMSFSLGNSGDEVILKVGSTVIDAVYYTNQDTDGDTFKDWPDTKGYSMTLGTLDAASNDDFNSWCLATSAYGPAISYPDHGDTNHGTPGAANDACAAR